ncbi:MAG TPA: BACON domain-containing carbohydrate-binding protein, partial [Blastocatellia bacterium]|nr:BACON domain-containing carbohydrate-binding protein [Blastocatellia bacterium]
RYNTDGTLDTSFDTDGKVTTPIGTGNDQAFGLAIQTDGKLVVAGHSSFDFAVVRYNTDGSLDTSFDTDGKVTTPIGTSLDQAYGVALQSDSKIVVAGESFNGTNRDFAVARYNTDGTLDASFDGDGKVTTALNTGNDSGAAVAIQGDGRVVVAGTSNPGTNLSFDDFAVVRYNPDGSLDTSFDSDGKVSTPIGAGADRGRALAIQSDSKIVVAGNSNNGTNDDFAVVRYNSNGSLDTSYGTGGKVVVDLSNGSDSANGVALDSLGRAVVVGGADGLFGVVRLLGDTQPSCNYSLVPASDYVSARGGPCSFNVTVGAGCQWTAQTSESWMVIVSDPSGTGNGSVSLEIRDNFTSSARLGTVTVGSENFTVVQEGRGASCGYTVSPTFAAYQVGGGSGTLNITTSAACGWRAVSAQSWIEITSTEVGIGGATINYTVSTNTTGAVRDGAIVVGGQSLKVKQKGS